MLRALPVVIVFIGLIIGLVVLARASRTARPVDPPERRLLDDAMILITQMRYPTQIDDVEIMSDRSKSHADRLIRTYDDMRAKELNK